MMSGVSGSLNSKGKCSLWPISDVFLAKKKFDFEGKVPIFDNGSGVFTCSKRL